MIDVVLLSGLWYQSDKDAVERFFIHAYKMWSIKNEKGMSVIARTTRKENESKTAVSPLAKGILQRSFLVC